MVPITRNTGLDQGTVLAPLLFCIATSDLVTLDDSPKCRIIKYADDTLVLHSIASENDLRHYQQTVDHVAAWSKENHLLLNASKTKEICFYFGKKAQLSTIATQQIFMDGEPIELVDEAVYLGVTFEKSLSWSLHIDEKVKAVNSKLFYLYKMKRNGFSAAQAAVFYEQAIRPIILYGVGAWLPYNKYLPEITSLEDHLKRRVHSGVHLIRSCNDAIDSIRYTYAKHLYTGHLPIELLSRPRRLYTIPRAVRRLQAPVVGCARILNSFNIR